MKSYGIFQKRQKRKSGGGIRKERSTEKKNKICLFIVLHFFAPCLSTLWIAPLSSLRNHLLVIIRMCRFTLLCGVEWGRMKFSCERKTLQKRKVIGEHNMGQFSETIPSSRLPKYFLKENIGLCSRFCGPILTEKIYTLI